MSSPPSRRGLATLAAVSVITSIAGCQSYEAKPLDLAAHERTWLARSPVDESVRAFAEQLAADGRPTTFDPSDGLDLAEAEIVALVYNAELRLARRRVGIVAATAEHAGRWSDPEFGLDVLSITESASNPLVVTPGLTFTIPISGRLEAEKARADAAHRVELIRVAEAEWRTRIEVRRAWIRWSSAVLRADRAEQLIASLDELVAATARLAEAGELPRTEAALFSIERSSQRQSLVRHRSDATLAALDIRALLGLSPSAPLDLVPTLAIGELDRPTADPGVEGNLTLSRLRQEYEVAERALRREIRRQYPDLTLGPLAEFDRCDSLLGFSLALPIPILNANRQGIAEAHAGRELARVSFETTYERLVGDVDARQRRLESLRLQREILETEIGPLVDRQLIDARRLLELGEGGSLVLLESLTRVARTQMALIDARVDEAFVDADLAELAGPPAATTEASETDAVLQTIPSAATPNDAAPASEVTP